MPVKGLYRRIPLRSLYRNREFQVPFWSMIYLASKVKLTFETDNGIKLNFQGQINHGPEWHVEFSIPIQTPYRDFSNFWVLKMSDFTKNLFSFTLAFDR